MDLQQELRNICQEVPGCKAAILMNLDGMVVMRHVEEEGGLDDEVLLIELTASVKQALGAVENGGGGRLQELVLHFERGTLVMRLLQEEHFIAMLIDPQALSGKSRYVLRTRSQPLANDLF